MEKKLVSIVCPAYQEELVLEQFFCSLNSVLEKLEAGYSFEVIIVDDGSNDKTLEILRKFSVWDDRWNYISLSRNFGHQAAITAGLDHARGDAVITLDCDLQHPPELIAPMLELWRNGAFVVFTKRENYEINSGLQGFLRKGFLAIFDSLNDLTIKSEFSDFRLLSRKALDGLCKYRESHRYLRGIIAHMGFPYEVLSFTPEKRFAGESKFKFSALVAYSLNGLFSFSLKPLKFLFLLSFMLFVPGMVFFVLINAKGSWNSEGNISQMVMVACMFVCSSMIMFGQALVAEYIGRLSEQSKNRPIYLEKEMFLHKTSRKNCGDEAERLLPEYSLRSLENHEAGFVKTP